MDGGRGDMSTWFREQIESVKYIFKRERQGEEQNLSLMFTTEGTMYIYGKQKSPEPNLVVKSRGNNVKKKYQTFVVTPHLQASEKKIKGELRKTP